jgi:hypothetical protein
LSVETDKLVKTNKELENTKKELERIRKEIKEIPNTFEKWIEKQAKIIPLSKK